MSTIIFNVVVDIVVHLWICFLEGGVVGQDGWGRGVQHRAAFLYVYDVMVASTDPVRSQGVFYTDQFFDRVGLRTNSGKTFGIICCACRAFRAAGTQSDAA